MMFPEAILIWTIGMLNSDTVYEMAFTYIINGAYVEQPEKI